MRDEERKRKEEEMEEMEEKGGGGGQKGRGQTQDGMLILNSGWSDMMQNYVGPHAHRHMHTSAASHAVFALIQFTELKAEGCFASLPL